MSNTFNRVILWAILSVAAILSGCGAMVQGAAVGGATGALASRAGLVGGDIGKAVAAGALLGGAVGAFVPQQPMVARPMYRQQMQPMMGQPMYQQSGYPQGYPGAPQQNHAQQCMMRTGSPAWQQIGPNQVRCLGNVQATSGWQQQQPWQMYPYGTGRVIMGGGQPPRCSNGSPVILSNPPRCQF